MSKVYVIFNPLKLRGIYYTWEDCKTTLKQCKGLGHDYSSFKTLQEAQEAAKYGSLNEYKVKKASTKLWLGKVQVPCLVVDAACSGCPGPVEYRGVVLPDGYEAFRHGPYVNGTNNIGEYLAIVTGLRWIEYRSLNFPLYSDSSCAIGWVKSHGLCNSHCDTIGPDLKMLVDKAESWMRGPTAHNLVSQRVRKWETNKWGEAPADFGRK